MASFKPEDEAAGILAAVVDSSDDAIIVTDLDGTVLTWNRGAERLYGYTAEEIHGRSIAVLIPETETRAIAAVLARVRVGHPVDDREAVGCAKDGHLVDVLLSASPIRNATGEVVGACSRSRDITARRQAELARRTSDGRWQSIVESAVDGIVVIDAQGRIEAFNPAAERLFGYREAEVVGQNVSVLMPAPYHEEHDGYLARYLDTGTAKIIGIGREVTGRRRDGSVFPLHLSVGEMVGDERKFTGILHDLSRRVLMEEQLREQAALARLGEMAAVIAHEVKNPLAGVRGAVQVIGSRLPQDGKDAAVVKDIVGRIDELDGLVNDLLLFARPPHPRPALTEIASLVTTIAELLSQDPALHGVRVQIDGLVSPIVADAALLRIVFLNLMVNGAHAMDGRGSIQVSLHTSDGSCEIAFADSGPGIPPEIRDKIFTPFFTTKAHGTGLGLPTARRLVEAHRGTISIECPPGGGTTVIVRLPVQ